MENNIPFISPEHMSKYGFKQDISCLNALVYSKDEILIVIPPLLSKNSFTVKMYIGDTLCYQGLCHSESFFTDLLLNIRIVK